MQKVTSDSLASRSNIRVHIASPTQVNDPGKQGNPADSSFRRGSLRKTVPQSTMRRKPRGPPGSRGIILIHSSITAMPNLKMGCWRTCSPSSAADCPDCIDDYGKVVGLSPKSVSTRANTGVLKWLCAIQITDLRFDRPLSPELCLHPASVRKLYPAVADVIHLN
jgi:hypothetical protein